MKKHFLFFITILLIFPTLSSANPLAKLKVPPGFSISIYAVVPGARQMALGKDGIVFVGVPTRPIGKVYALIPDKSMTTAKKVLVIASRLDTPNGVAFHRGALYVAETGRILRYANIMKNLNHPPKPTVITDKLPKKRHHGRRYIKFGPDGNLYLGIGAPCNNCLSTNPLYGSISRMRADGTGLHTYAQGVRNAVGFAWSPLSGKLWFTDNGRDWMGDNLPPDKLNYASQANLHFGYPYVYGNNIPAPLFGHLKNPNDFTPPALELPAHSAALGMTFYTGKMFPQKYHQQIFIAQHGSWNRSKKIGYQVIWVHVKNNKALGWEALVTGWLQGQKVLGRPVDVLVMPDGALLISDDYAGLIYRLSFKGNSR